jgi:prevent-host-death family protein
MEAVRHIPKTELARHVRQVIKAVQRGQMAVVESHGEPEAAIIDIVDYHLLRAAMHFYAYPPQIDPQTGLTDEVVTGVTDVQARYNLVLAHYLSGAISLARAAELLQLSWLDLRTRCLRVDIPVRTAPTDLTSVLEDAATAAAWPQSPAS